MENAQNIDVNNMDDGLPKILFSELPLNNDKFEGKINEEVF